MRKGIYLSNSPKVYLYPAANCSLSNFFDFSEILIFSGLFSSTGIL